MMTTGQYCVSRNWKGLNTAKVPRVLTSYFLPLSLSQSSSIFTIISHSLHIITSTDLNRRHPANEEEHKENKSQAEQLRILVEGGDKTKQVDGEECQDKVEVVERKEDVVDEVKGWAKQEEVQLVKRCGETEEEEEERRLEKARKEEEEMEVKKLDEMIAMREKERERQRLEEEEMRKRKAKEKEEEEEKKETESKVDEENNSVPVTPIRKVLSRTSSFEVREEVFIVLPLTSSR